MIYCIVPADLKAELHDELLCLYAQSATVMVLRDRRETERRTHVDRRAHPREPGSEQRLDTRRTSTDRRVRPPAHRATVRLPASLRPYARRLVCVRVPPASGHAQEGRLTEQLVDLAKARNATAFDGLYVRFAPAVYQYVNAMLRDSQEAEDAVQEVFATVHRVLPGYQARGSGFRGWLFTIARNEAFRRLRRQKAIAEDPHQILHRHEQHEREPAAGATFRDLDASGLLALSEQLPLEQRQVLLLRFGADWTQEQTGRRLGKSSDAVRMLEARAKNSLRKTLVRVPARSHVEPQMRQSG